jgi:hypothetical protein
MLIDLAGKNKWNESAAAAPPAAAAPKPANGEGKKSSAAPASAPAVPAIQKGFLNKASKTKSPAAAPAAPATPLVQVLSTDDQPPREVKKASAPPAGPTSPDFTMTERGILNLGDFGAGGGLQVSSTRPAELVYRIDIPLATKTSEVELDVGERLVSLSSPPVCLTLSRQRPQAEVWRGLRSAHQTPVPRLRQERRRQVRQGKEATLHHAACATRCPALRLLHRCRGNFS